MQGHCINCDKVEIPQLPDVVVPRYHSLHWIPHHIDIDWHVQIKPANKISNMYCAIVLNNNEKLFSHACLCVSTTKLIVFHAVNLGDAHSLCVLSCTQKKCLHKRKSWTDQTVFGLLSSCGKLCVRTTCELQSPFL